MDTNAIAVVLVTVTAAVVSLVAAVVAYRDTRRRWRSAPAESSPEATDRRLLSEIAQGVELQVRRLAEHITQEVEQAAARSLGMLNKTLQRSEAMLESVARAQEAAAAHLEEGATTRGAAWSSVPQRAVALWTATTQLAETLLRLGRTDEALSHYRQALQIAQEERAPALYVQSMLNASLAYREIGNAEESLRLNREALEVIRRLTNG